MREHAKGKEYQFNKEDIEIPQEIGTAHLRHGIDEDGRELLS